MKNIRKYKTRLVMVLTILLTTICTSCEKLVDIGSPKNRILNEDAFTNDANAISALMGLYFTMAGYTNNALAHPTILSGMTADELISFSATDATYINNAVLSSDSNLATYWRNLYNGIYQANLLIEGVQSSKGLSEAVRKQIMGEALFMRAFCYFYLISFFDDVPLVMQSDVSKSASLPRTSVNAVYQQIIKDLEESKSMLNAAYPSAGRLRVNKYCAAALLGRIYLYQKQWAKAEEQATELIGSGLYTPLPALAQAFKPDSQEAILQFYIPNGFTFIGSRFIPAATTPSFALASGLEGTFEQGDNRKTEWAKSIVFGGNTYWYPYKYKNRTAAASAENMMVLRAGELYLIRAEARIQQDNIAEGIKDLNVMRTRARAIPTVGVPNPLPDLVLNLSKTDALTAVEKERRVELFAEWGNRWFDLRRTGRIDAVLSALKPAFWQSTDALYPIPDAERARNPNLTQNNGYQ